VRGPHPLRTKPRACATCPCTATPEPGVMRDRRAGLRPAALLPNGASPQPDEPCRGGWAWLTGLRSATDGDSVRPVIDRLWR
jgi:hypothetical protein